MFVLRFFIILALVVFLAGCASVFNPYSSDFTCPQSEQGTCAPVRTVYEETKAGVTYPAKELDCFGDGGSSSTGCEKGSDKKSKDDFKRESQESLYITEKQRKLGALLKDPQTPVAIPPKVLRIAVLPYVGGNNELYMPRYIYMFADSPEWVISNITGVEE